MIFLLQSVFWLSLAGSSVQAIDQCGIFDSEFIIPNSSPLMDSLSRPLTTLSTIGNSGNNNETRMGKSSFEIKNTYKSFDTFGEYNIIPSLVFEENDVIENEYLKIEHRMSIMRRSIHESIYEPNINLADYNECKKNNFCPNVSDYPYSEYVRHLSKVHLIPQLEYSANKTTVCKTLYTTVAPQAAKMRNGSWYFIVNPKGLEPQKIKMGLCNVTKDEEGKDSIIAANIESDYEATCKQEYTERPLKAMRSDNGAVFEDYFYLPSYCYCVISNSEYTNDKSDTDINDTSDNDINDTE